MVMAHTATMNENPARADPPGIYLGASDSGKKYGEKKWDAFAKPFTSDSAAARLIRGRGMVDASHAKDKLNAQYDPTVNMNIAVYRPATLDLGRPMTRAFPMVDISIGMAMCEARSSSLEDETATPTDAINAKAYGGAVKSKVFCESYPSDFTIEGKK